MQFGGQEIHESTLIHVQPTPFFRVVYGRADLAPSEQRTHRIAYWYWEFDHVPDDWEQISDEIDEIWTATEFVAKGLRARFDVPVRTLFPGVLLAPYGREPRSSFGLPEEAFTFVFVFHMMSVMERKNPLGLIRAFRQAFRPDEPVRLVLKTSFGDRHPEQFGILQEAANQDNIVLINEVYPSSRVLSLMDACDAYVSLHRSEGLGLTMAEAMLMGKPVIATNYSGNTDFMDASNSLLVDYELVSVGKGIPPYSEDSEWAEPSVDHAAQLMRKVYLDQEWSRALGATAKLASLNRLAPEVAGRRIARRLAEIQLLRSKTMPR
jgi:glycosyltransferase involved in cell wall biosynthesis